MVTIFRRISSSAIRTAKNYAFISNPSRRKLESIFRPPPHFPFNNLGAKRSYYVDRYNVEHFRQRGPRRWFDNPKTALIVVIVGGGALASIYYGNIETVPYTNRRHFVLLSNDMENQLAEQQFDQIKDSFKGKILPNFHPESLRVKVVSQRVIDSLKRGLRNEKVGGNLGYASPKPNPNSTRGDYPIGSLTNGDDGHHSFPEEELLDENWVENSRQKGIERGAKAATAHLESFKWEVIVVNDNMVNAFCLPGGKIVVFMGLLKLFRSDAEVAAVIGHEVAHAVARHSAETMTKNFFFAIVRMMLYQFIVPDVANVMSTLLLKLPFSRKMEVEADYIGVLLMASAGYDPRTAPLVYEKLGKVAGDSALQDYLSTHPSGKRRAMLLAKAHVMDEALSLYWEYIAGHQIEGFL